MIRLAASLLFAALAAVAEPCGEGAALLEMREWRGAQTKLWECVAGGNAARDRAYELTITYRELKNYADGFQRLAAADRVTLDLLYIRAFLLFRTNRSRESIDALSEAHRIDPNDWRIHQLFGLNYVVLKIDEGAEHELRRAAGLNPGNAEIWYHLARFLYSKNRPEESAAAAQRALVLAPGYADAHNSLALCFEALGKSVEAAAHYGKAIGLNAAAGRKDEWPHLNYAAFLLKEQQAEESLAQSDKAIDINPSSGRANYLRGKALARLDRRTAARQALERAIELDPGEPAAYYELGVLLRKMGDAAASRQMLERFQTVRSGR